MHDVTNKASENLTNGAEKNVSEGKNAARLDAVF